MLGRTIAVLMLCTVATAAAAPLPHWVPDPGAIADKQAAAGDPLAAYYAGLPPGSATPMRRSADKSGLQDGWMRLPDGSLLEVEGLQVMELGGGIVSYSGTVAGAGAAFAVLMTVGPEGSFGTLTTPSGLFRFESRGERGWLLDADHPGIETKSYGSAAIQPPGFVPPGPVADKNTVTVIDVLFVWSPGFAARYPGTLAETRVQHLNTLANQTLANSDVPLVLRVVGAEPIDWPDINGSNNLALQSMRSALASPATAAPGLGQLAARRNATGADLVSFIWPHDIETRGSCGVAYFPGPDPSFGVHIVSDGFSSWSLCSDLVYIHEVGHNLGAEHQIGQTSANPGFGTAWARPGQFHTVMGSFGSGNPNRGLTLARFSNPQQLCGGRPCGQAGVADNARRLRETMASVAAYRSAVSNRPVPPRPLPQDPDVDGDGVPESADAFPFDPRFSSDRDGDGIPDELDAFPDDPSEWADTDGDGIGDNRDPDIDGDGVPNEVDAFPRDRFEWADSDGDGVGDNADAFPLDPREWADTDGDGIGDNADPDIDGDGRRDYAAPGGIDSVDLLVLSAGTDRVISLDGSSGRLRAVEIAERHVPQALGPQAALAWNPHQKRVYALVAGGIRRYDRALRARVDILLPTFRQSNDPGPLMPSSFPAGLAIDAAGTVYLADSGTRQLARIDGVTGRSLPGGVFGQQAFDSAPRALAFDAMGKLWTLERDGRARRIDPASGTVERSLVLGFGGTPVANPTALAFAPDGRLLVADAAFDQVLALDLDQPVNSRILVGPGAPADLRHPAGLAVGPDGHLYVSSLGSDAVLRFSLPDGQFLGVFSDLPPGVLREPRALLFVPRVLDRDPYDPRRSLRPVLGNWFDPERPGHGLDIQAFDDQLMVIWYTYEADGRPTWYLGQGSIELETWQAPMLRFEWREGGPVSTVLGSMRLEFSTENRARFDWQIGELQGSETMVGLPLGRSIETQFPTANWFDPQDAGWGLSLMRQGENDFAVLFAYAPDGAPTWAVGQAPVGADPMRLEFELLRFRRPDLCPGCSGTADGSPQPSGSLLLRLDSDSSGRLDLDARGDGLVWQRPALRLARLTESPTFPGGDPLNASRELPCPWPVPQCLRP